MPADWVDRAAAALERLQRDRWTFPAARYLDVIDDVVAGEFTVNELTKVHGSADLVETALGHVTTAIQGGGLVKPLGAGGWYERQGKHYAVNSEFVAAWEALRGGEKT